MQALGDHLGADEDVDLVRFEFPQDVLERVFFAHRVGVDAGEAGFRQHLLQDLLDLLRAVALQSDSGVFALRAFFRDDGLVAADMADQPFIGAVVGECDGAVRAGAGMAAGMALQRAGEAAAVEEKNRLLALREALFKSGAEAVGEDRDLAFLLLLFQAHVDHADERHGVGVGAFVEAEQVVFPRKAVLPTLQRGRGGAEDDGARLERGAQNRHIAGVVARRAFLFIGGLVFLIDDDQPEVRQWREHGGARTNYDACRTFADAVPLIETLALREVRVQDGDLVVELGKASLEAPHGLRCERDFRDEDEHRFPQIKRGLRGLEIDFGFARAGDA